MPAMKAKVPTSTEVDPDSKYLEARSSDQKRVLGWNLVSLLSMGIFCRKFHCECLSQPLSYVAHVVRMSQKSVNAASPPKIASTSHLDMFMLGIKTKTMAHHLESHLEEKQLYASRVEGLSFHRWASASHPTHRKHNLLSRSRASSCFDKPSCRHGEHLANLKAGIFGL